jgi:hypothetical protein
MLMDVYPACDQSRLHHNSGHVTTHGIRHAVERHTGIMRHQTSIPEKRAASPTRAATMPRMVESIPLKAALILLAYGNAAIS